MHLVRTQNFRKINISYPACAYQGVENVSFSENFAHVLNEWSLMEILNLVFVLFFRYNKSRKALL